MNPVVHFEMPYDDRGRLNKFYREVFGWKMEDYGEEMGNYVVAATAETDEQGMLLHPGAINGGFFPRAADPAVQCPSVVVSVPDLKEAMKKVTDAGGQILAEPMEILGIGHYVSILDTEGNRVGVMQSFAMQ